MEQNKKIIFLAKLYYPHIGGVEKHVQFIAGSLMSKNFSVSIITEQHDKSLKKIDHDKKTKIYRIPTGKSVFFKKFYIWYWFFRNLSLLKKADVIHIHDVFYWILPFYLFIPKDRIYITFHGYEGFPFKLKWRILRKIYETLSNGNICVGDFMKKWYGTNPDFVIYGAVKNKIRSFKPKKKSIVFFGRLDDQTNVIEYTNGFKKLYKNDEKWSLTVYGDGKYRRKIQKPIKVHPFLVNISDKLPQYEYVFVSRYLSMLEAMIAKRLTFAYYDNEIKKDYLLMSPFKKYVVVVSSPQELAEKLEYYSKNTKEKDEIIEKAYKFAQKQTWDNLLNIYLNLWVLKAK